MATLGLGTVQFGLNYGISNNAGKPSLSEIQKILNHFCLQSSPAIIDTAQSYGESELILGNFLNIYPKARIITKIPPLRSENMSRSILEYYETTLADSLQKLRLDAVDTLMTHHSLDFQGPVGPQISQFLKSAKQQKKCKRIGISAYSEEEVQFVIDHFFVPDVIQLPMNIFDQQLHRSGYLKKLKNLGIEIHIRSAYLQGLIFLDPQTINPYFSPIQNKLTELHSFLFHNNISPAHYALQFLNAIPEIDFIILGINNLNELLEAEKFMTTPLLLSSENCQFDRWNINDINFTNPSAWKLKN